MTSDQSKNTFRPPPPRPPWTYLQTPDVSTSFVTYSPTLNQTSTYDSSKTAFPLRRIRPAMNVFFSLSFAFFTLHFSFCICLTRHPYPLATNPANRKTTNDQ